MEWLHKRTKVVQEIEEWIADADASLATEVGGSPEACYYDGRIEALNEVLAILTATKSDRVAELRRQVEEAETTLADLEARLEEAENA